MGLSQIAAHFLIELTLCYKHMRAIIFGPSQEEFGPNLLKMGQKHKCTSAASQVTPSFKLCMSEATMGVGKQVCAMILNSKKISLPLHTGTEVVKKVRFGKKMNFFKISKNNFFYVLGT